MIEGVVFVCDLLQANVMTTWLELSVNKLSFSLVNKSFVYHCRTIYKCLHNVTSHEFKIATILFSCFSVHLLNSWLWKEIIIIKKKQRRICFSSIHLHGVYNVIFAILTFLPFVYQYQIKQLFELSAVFF